MGVFIAQRDKNQKSTNGVIDMSISQAKSGLIAIRASNQPQGTDGPAVTMRHYSFNADYDHDANRGQEITSDKEVHELSQRKWFLQMNEWKQMIESLPVKALHVQ